ncbi:MAG: hypothetical protein IT297_10260, partial [Anaerolineae bacterium]|nr:hypothetical protein [Anaerolineae bacterium]
GRESPGSRIAFGGLDGVAEQILGTSAIYAACAYFIYQIWNSHVSRRRAHPDRIDADNLLIDT